MSTLSGLFPSGGGGIQLIREDIITVSGVYTKPSDILPTDVAYIDLWGGGGSGAKHSSTGPGGIPGWWVGARMFAEEIADSTDVVIGAGGVGPTTTVPRGAGGATLFGSIMAPGGGDANNYMSGGHQYYFSRYTAGSSINAVTEITTSLSTVYAVEAPGVLGGAVTGTPLPDALGTGNPNALQNGLPIARRGGFGGGANSTVQNPGQISIMGGNGGFGAFGGGTAGDGEPRGGGGGGAGDSLVSKAGDGGRGEVRIRYFRGGLL